LEKATVGIARRDTPADHRAKGNMYAPSDYTWQRPYDAASLCTDRTRILGLVDLAQAAITARITEIESTGDNSPTEMRAIADAYSGLRIVVKKACDIDL
jgi:hypothetical protein